MSALPLLDPVAGHAAAATVAVVLITGALPKLRDPALFQAALDNYRLLPDALLRPAARVLPLLEVAAGVALLPLSWRVSGAVLAMLVLALVSAAVALRLRAGGRMDCGCGGDTEVPLSRGLLVRNAVLLGLAALAAWPVAERATVWLDAVNATLACLFMIGLYHAANLWLAHQPRLLELKELP